jgi:hypothetical protein
MMPEHQHQDMRTTLTLDEDVAAKLKAESRRAGRPFRDVVNETLRRGLSQRPIAGSRQAFTIAARDLGNLKPGLPLDNVAELRPESGQLAAYPMICRTTSGSNGLAMC